MKKNVSLYRSPAYVLHCFRAHVRVRTGLETPTALLNTLTPHEDTDGNEEPLPDSMRLTSDRLHNSGVELQTLRRSPSPFSDCLD